MNASSTHSSTVLWLAGFIALGCLSMPTGVHSSSIYKCVDLDGRTSYTSMPCADLELLDKVIERQADNRVNPRRIPSQRDSSAAPYPSDPDLGEALPYPGAGNTSSGSPGAATSPGSKATPDRPGADT